MDILLNITTILAYITPWVLPLSLVILPIFIVIDIFKKKFYYSKFALFFAAITIILLIIQISLTYKLTKSIINSPSQNSTSSETANWKTYTNTTYGYAIKYPDTYEVPAQSERQISQLGKDNNMIVEKKSEPSGSSVIIIDVSTDKDDMSLKDYMNKNLKLYGITGPLISYNFNGYDSMFNKNQPGTDVFVKQGQRVYHITAPAASSDKEIGDIVATFKFTDQTSAADVSNWKTYTNTLYGFSLKYPDVYIMQKCGGEATQIGSKYIADGTEVDCVYPVGTSASIEASNIDINFSKGPKNSFISNKTAGKGTLTTINGRPAYITFIETTVGSSISATHTVKTKVVDIEQSSDTAVTLVGFYDKPSAITLFDTILSTFKFTN